MNPVILGMIDDEIRKLTQVRLILGANGTGKRRGRPPKDPAKFALQQQLLSVAAPKPAPAVAALAVAKDGSTRGVGARSAEARANMAKAQKKRYKALRLAQKKAAAAQATAAQA